MKCYYVNLTVQDISKGTTTEKEARLNIDDTTKIGYITKFQAQTGDIVRTALKAIKDGLHVKLEISTAIYDSNISQKSYNRWYLDDCSDVDGLYMKPDTKYTAIEHDMYIKPKTLWADLGSI